MSCVQQTCPRENGTVWAEEIYSNQSYEWWTDVDGSVSTVRRRKSCLTRRATCFFTCEVSDSLNGTPRTCHQLCPEEGGPAEENTSLRVLAPLQYPIDRRRKTNRRSGSILVHVCFDSVIYALFSTLHTWTNVHVKPTPGGESVSKIRETTEVVRQPIRTTAKLTKHAISRPYGD